MKSKIKKIKQTMRSKRLDLTQHQARLSALPFKGNNRLGWWLLLGFCLILVIYLFTKF